MYSETWKPRGALQEKHPLWLMHDELQILYDDTFNRGKKVKGKSNSQSNEKNQEKKFKGKPYHGTDKNS